MAMVANDGRLPLISDQVEMVPSSVANRNCAGVSDTLKSSATGLKTMPVGVEGSFPFGGAGTPTAKGTCATPDGSKILACPVLLSAIQNGSFGLKAMPQGLVNPGATCAAVPA